MKQVVLLLLLWAVVGTDQAFAEDLIIDGATQTITTIPPKSYDTIQVKNGGNLIVNGWQYITADTLVVDESSTVRAATRMWREYWGGEKGVGGSNGGRGSGPNTFLGFFPEFGVFYPLENAHRRVDALYPGQNGGWGDTFIFSCHYPPGNEVILNGTRGGGGALCVGIRASRIEVHGYIAANGEKPPVELQFVDLPCVHEYVHRPSGGGGAGGSISLIASEMILGPSAVIEADGANSASGGGYGGGGGRIKIYYESGSVDPRAAIKARGGRNLFNDYSYGPAAEDGTIVILQVSNVDHLFNPSADINEDGRIDEQDLFLLSSQWNQVDAFRTITPTPTITPDWTATPTKTPTVTNTPTITPTPTPTWQPGLSDTDLTIETGTQNLQGFVVRRNVRIRSSGRLWVSGTQLTLWCDTLQIDQGGMIDGNEASGFTLGTPPKAQDDHDGGGASHGGLGQGSPPVYGATDGDLIDPGSKGGVGGDHRWLDDRGVPRIVFGGSGGPGGAGVEIRAASITISGGILVNGGTGSQGWGGPFLPTAPFGGGGSGGGILLVADNLILGPSAVLQAEGWPGYSATSLSLSGGGGRIKIFYRQTLQMAPSAILSASGNEDGTIHIQKLE